jgi:hypothetical protein
MNHFKSELRIDASCLGMTTLLRSVSVNYMLRIEQHVQESRR